MRLHMQSPDRKTVSAAIEEALQSSPGDCGSLRRLAELDRQNPEAWVMVQRTLSVLSHDQVGTAPKQLARAFDTAVRLSPEGSVALYALGNSDLLVAATDEVVVWLKECARVRPNSVVLDLGCGIGRVTAALARDAAFVVAVDVSREMLGAARRRCTSAKAGFVQTSGLNLAAFADASFDAVVAVDVFPYLVQAGGDLALRHFEETARVLRPGGAFAILNYSYRGEMAVDRMDVAALAQRTGYVLVQNGQRPFKLWDGSAFLLSPR